VKKFGLVLTTIILFALLTACGKDSSDSKAEGGKELNDKKLLIGVTAGMHEEIMEKVAEVAKKDGLEIETKVFSDYILPNTSLSEGDLDANSYQHKPFLNAFNKDHKTDLVAAGATALNPMGIYSDKLKDIKDLPKKGKYGLPNDPTNGARALLILEKAGLIKLKDGIGDKATVYDVEENKRNLEFVELDAAQIPKQLSELDAAAINTNFAMEAGLTPNEDSIFLEDRESPYVNEIVVRAENKNDPVVKKLIKAYHSDEVKNFIEDKYKGSIIAGW